MSGHKVAVSVLHTHEPSVKNRIQKAGYTQQALNVWKFISIGAFFGIILAKAQVISWFRVQEMFRFQSFHMYGVIGSAVAVGALSVWLIKRFNIRSISGERIHLPAKVYNHGYWIGGTCFGLGWALVGACPGPIYALIGSGYVPFIVIFLFAVVGTYLYGLLKDRLPH